ncbi:hypothetical protein [Sulfurivermis fontis]|jgi:hypothetical protein|uniref:hypothetical protein n=1 Tax=Sulfurivermis fontis TaxID=1972068 RepID=UPI001558A536|nr:hypothetical protein [Sulfurivermis fontis]
MQHLLQQAARYHLTRVYATVSRAAEGFFARYGLVMACVQTVAVQNARMVLPLPGVER